MRTRIEGARATRFQLRRCTLAIWLALGFAACDHEPPVKRTAAPSGVATGSILVEVLSPRERDSYWQYRITPSSGDLTLVGAGMLREDEQVEPKMLTGWESCYKEITARSPDGRFVARCLEDDDGMRTQFTIKANGREVFRWSPPDWRGVDGFAWPPDSRSLALLNHASRRGTWPLERLWAYLGHAVPHNTFYLSIIDVESGRSVDYLVHENVVAGMARILDWTP